MITNTILVGKKESVAKGDRIQSHSSRLSSHWGLLGPQCGISTASEDEEYVLEKNQAVDL